MVGRTFATYLSRNFTKSILMVFGLLFAIIYLSDFVELLRRSGDAKGATTAGVAFLSLLRVPTITEQIFPFSVLFGAMFAFLNLTRKLELVVARAAGLSVWQFILPPLGVALVLGIVTTTVYNPVAAISKQRAERLETRMFGKTGSEQVDTAFWIQQDGVDGQTILRADRASDGGAVLSGITAFVYDRDGSFMERVEAEHGELHAGYWTLDDAKVMAPGEPPRDVKTEIVATNITPEQVQQKFTAPDSVPFWSLPQIRDSTEKAGLNAVGLRAAIPEAPGPSAAVHGHDPGGGGVFLKILPLWWDRPHGGGWSGGGLRALRRDEARRRSRRRRPPECPRGGVVSRPSWGACWARSLCCIRRMADGAAFWPRRV